MKYRQDNNAMFLRAKINAVWKTMRDDTPNFFANNGKLERMFRCQRHATINLGNELKGRARPIRLVSCHALASMNSALAAR
jgi:hypothetical protein